jgi:transposase-like protein
MTTMIQPPRPDAPKVEGSPTCPNCGSQDVYRIPGHVRLTRYECRACRTKWRP